MERLDPPHDHDAEMSVIGSCLSLGRIPEGVADLRDQHFYRPSHGLIWEAMRTLVGDGRPCDTITTRDYITSQGRDFVRMCGGPDYLATLLGSAGVFGVAEAHAQIVRDKAGLRDIINTAVRIAQDAHQGIDDPETVRLRAEQLLDGIDTGRSSEDDLSTLLTLDEFADQEVTEAEFVVSNLLRRGERLVLTGWEGLGKTSLLRQIGVAAAGGFDPFTGRSDYPRRKVLAVDAENPLGIMVDRWRELRNIARRRGTPAVSLLIDRREEGMDLSTAADMRWLRRRMQAVQPDLLLIGPTYKLYIGGTNEKEEDLARRITSQLDLLRREFNCAVILEAHSAKGQGGSRSVAPINSSLWLRWPEFGYGLRWSTAVSEEEAQDRRLVDFAAWRGDRDVRPWPRHLESGGETMPWVECEVPAA